MTQSLLRSFFFFNDTATTEIYTLSLHDALPIWRCRHIVKLNDTPRKIVYIEIHRPIHWSSYNSTLRYDDIAAQSINLFFYLSLVGLQIKNRLIDCAAMSSYRKVERYPSKNRLH